MLSGFGLDLLRSGHVRHQRGVHEDHVLAALLQADLTDRLKERQRLDVAYGTADFGDADIGVTCAQEHGMADFVGNVGNHLHGRAQISSAALAADDRVVDAPGGEIGVPPGLAAAHESLVVSQIKVSFGPVGRYEHLAMLKGAHGAGIHVEVRIQLDHADGQAAGLENRAQGGGGDAFPQRGNHRPPVTKM